LKLSIGTSTILLLVWQHTQLANKDTYQPVIPPSSHEQ